MDFKSIINQLRWSAGSIILISIPFLAMCQSNKTTIQEYDFENVQSIQLEKELEEISGIAIRDKFLYSISDDKGKLYRQDPQSGKILDEWKFGKADDYESLVYFSNRFFVLNSNGDISSFAYPTDENVKVEEYKFPFGRDNEFEILYVDANKEQLILICKECKDDPEDKLSVFTFNPANGEYGKSSFEIDVRKIFEVGGEKFERLKPSSAEIHPVNGDLYMISSINKLIMRFDREGKVKEVHTLKRSLYEQPEGLAFMPNGDMLITNEAGSKKHATLLLLPFKSQ